MKSLTLFLLCFVLAVVAAGGFLKISALEQRLADLEAAQSGQEPDVAEVSETTPATEAETETTPTDPGPPAQSPETPRETVAERTDEPPPREGTTAAAERGERSYLQRLLNAP